MKHKKIPDWIHVDFHERPPLIVCTRCNGSRSLYLPAAMVDVILQGRAFAESHKFCKDKGQ